MPRLAAILVLISLILGAISTVAVSWSVAAARPCNAEWLGYDTPSSAALTPATGPHTATWAGRDTAGSFGVDRGTDVLLICQGRAFAHRALLSERLSHPVEMSRFREFLSSSGRLHTGIDALPSWSRLEISPEPDAQSRLHSLPGPFNPDRFSYVVNAYGWPALAMRGAKIEMPPTGGFLREHPLSIILGKKRHVVPASIIWPGFLINTVTFAAMWFIAILHGGRAAHGLAARIRVRRARRRGMCPTCGYDLLGDYSTGCPECGWKRKVAPLRAT